MASWEMAGWENVAKYDGLAVTLAGLTVVFGVLSLISISIALLPRILANFPGGDEPAPPVGRGQRPEATAVEAAAIAAAACFAVHLESESARNGGV